MTPFMDKVFYLDDEDNIYYLTTFIIEDMFKASKLKKKSDYKPKFVYKLELFSFVQFCVFYLLLDFLQINSTMDHNE